MASGVTGSEHADVEGRFNWLSTFYCNETLIGTQLGQFQSVQIIVALEMRLKSYEATLLDLNRSFMELESSPNVQVIFQVLVE